MTRAFIVRPFGLKEGVDFDAVEAALIQPALRKAGIQGSTTAEIVEQGNIREDMFRLLVTADLVVADLSIHNANVFYELGIRHGLRPSATFLLRADVHRYPFDLQTDRYLVYDASNPAAKAGDLARALAATVRSSRVDSPVYQILPNLRAPDPAVLRVVPSDFREDVGRAHAERWRGDLRLFAHEARDFEWASEGLRTVGRAQFDLGAHPGAKETFEWLLALVPDDVEAHQMLATIYQRLGDLTRSSQAVQRVIDAPAVRRRDRAEAFALRARNAKARLRSALAGKGSAEAREAALRAPQLGESFESYRAGFTQDLNHFYPGLNALALLCIRNELAKELPDVWSEQFDSDEDAKRARDAGLATFRQLAAAVELSLECSRRVVEHRADADPPRLWERISEADFAFLTGSRPKAVARRYREALDGAPSFAVGSVREQLELFEQLGVRKEFVSEALAVVRALDSGGTELAPAPRPKRVLLFSGHMVDAPGRTPPRFPRTAAAEAEARRMIRGAVENERSLEPGQVLGVAGGASGGDILFHEVCAELGVETALYLALPRDAYRARSVQHGGPRWVERYDRLCDRLPVRVFAADEELPRWLRGKPDYGFWHRSTLWLLFNALAVDAASLTLVALWDREDGDGPGGTGDLVSHVEERGHKTVLLDATELKKFTE